MIISHFDEDHVGGIFSVLKEFDVRKVIIGEQYEISENYKQFLEIVKEQRILVKIVKKGNQINIEKDTKISILFPDSNYINENILNNNSLVSKFEYKDFSILFTGDIEKIAEDELVNMYKKSNILKSTVLKVAHHGSKSSSTEKFLELVSPQIALIGVGKNNTFGHPNSEILKILVNKRGKSFENRYKW